MKGSKTYTPRTFSPISSLELAWLTQGCGFDIRKIEQRSLAAVGDIGTYEPPEPPEFDSQHSSLVGTLMGGGEYIEPDYEPVPATTPLQQVVLCGAAVAMLVLPWAAIVAVGYRVCAWLKN